MKRNEYKDLNQQDFEKLKEILAPYKSNQILINTIIIILLGFSILIFYSGFLQKTILIKYLVIVISISIFCFLSNYYFYLIKTRKYKRDINSKKKIIKIIKIKNKGIENFGTFTSNNYLAVGSSISYYFASDQYKWLVCKEIYDKINIGDLIEVEVTLFSDVVINITNTNVSAPVNRSV